MTDAKLEIPDAIATALGDWVRQMADEASAGPRAAQARSEEELQAARDELSSVSAARDQAQALAAERNEEIEQLMAELRNARSIATDALVGKAKDQLAIEGKDAQPADLRAQIERNVAATAALSDARPGGRDGLVAPSPRATTTPLKSKNCEPAWRPAWPPEKVCRRRWRMRVE
jgi:chromosome segregation ATPase